MMKIFLVVAALFALAACGDRDPMPQGERTYQGKPDTPPWGTGDRANWETKLKARQLTQNEYKRINEK